MHGIEQRPETFLFDKQNGVEAVFGAAGQIIGDGRDRDRRRAYCPQSEIVPHFESAERNFPAGVRLNKGAARIPDDVPAGALGGVFGHVIGKQGLGEIGVVERILAGYFEDRGAR